MIQRTAGAVAAVLVATLSGCGTAPASLHPMAQATALQIQAPVKWTSHRSFHDYELSLVPGTYVAVGESEDGTYFLGPAPCLLEVPLVKDQPRGGIARNCGFLKPRKAGAQPTVFFVQDGFWMVTEFDADGMPLRDKLVEHRGMDGRPDAAPKPSILDRNAPTIATADVAGASHGIGTNAVGAALGTGLVAGFIAADLGTYHDVDTQPPAGWLQAAKAPN